MISIHFIVNFFSFKEQFLKHIAESDFLGSCIKFYPGINVLLSLDLSETFSRRLLQKSLKRSLSKYVHFIVLPRAVATLGVQHHPWPNLSTLIRQIEKIPESAR